MLPHFMVKRCFIRNELRVGHEGFKTEGFHCGPSGRRRVRLLRRGLWRRGRESWQTAFDRCHQEGGFGPRSDAQIAHSRAQQGIYPGNGQAGFRGDLCRRQMGEHAAEAQELLFRKARNLRHVRNRRVSSFVAQRHGPKTCATPNRLAAWQFPANSEFGPPRPSRECARATGPVFPLAGDAHSTLALGRTGRVSRNRRGQSSRGERCRRRGPRSGGAGG